MPNSIDAARVKQYLKEFKLVPLFIEELGWDHHKSTIEVPVSNKVFILSAVARKRGMVVYACSPDVSGSIPDYPTRRKIDQEVSKSVREHLIIFFDAGKKEQVWQWVKREPGRPAACREQRYYSNQTGDALVQKLQHIAFSLEDEEGLTLFGVTEGAHAAFDVEKVTKKFYELFKTEHAAFLKFLKGIPDEDMERWYVSVMINRLMFIYFIQKKGFLNGDIDYLRNKLYESKKQGKDLYYTNFLCPLFFEGFAKNEKDRDASISKMLGKIPYLNGGLFLRHQIEELHGKNIKVPDAAFERMFEFFEKYQWHLDERPLREGNEINPDVLGYIFEKYINQKQMGAYYSKEDITGYISKNTVIPFLFDAAKQKCKIAFEGAHTIWSILQADPDRYIYDAVKKGVELNLPKEIAVGLKDVFKRAGWNRPASGEYALPTEIWREVVARRQRYVEVRDKLAAGEVKSINDLITYNLDIRQFAQDVIENSEGPELLRAFYRAIEKITVLDPTCGSGAFLFAALNILEPLYESCLDRMQVFLDDMERSNEKHHPEKFSDFRKVLEQVTRHPNRRYFILKSIVINNLYGVDIMPEAVEICKLRLFLKLVAQVERVEDIEPLPDIDFNIRAGNTLVGYASYDEVKKAVTSKLDFDNAMGRIDESAEIADRAFQRFRYMQTEQGMDPKDFADTKGELRRRLKTLEEELNRHLAGEYGVDVNKKATYEKWLASYLPFHWFIEFYRIIKTGGFDVIIGNPPYVEYSKIKSQYLIKDYSTESCGNLFAFVIERSLKLINKEGLFSLIVPHSLAATYRSNAVQKLLLNTMNGHYSYYTRRPGKLFEGADQCLCIFVLTQKDAANSSTTYQRWYTEERKYLFDKMKYQDIDLASYWGKFSVYPKLGNVIESNILKKISCQKSLNYIMTNSGFEFYCHRISRYFIKATNFIPYFCSERDGIKRSDDFKVYYVNKPRDAAFVVAALNSSLFYWFWRVMFDGYHCGKENINAFPFEPAKVSTETSLKLKALVPRLMKSFISGAIRKQVNYKGSGTVEYDEFNIKSSKPIIDEIDRVLAEHYGFTDEELDFIINYDIKYRMGQDAVDEEE
ncbi:MAG: DNA methyltransferase [Nitrospirota bacterium]